VWAPQHAAVDPGRSRNTYPAPDLPTAQLYRFETAVFPEVTKPQLSSMQGVSLASAAAKPLFSIASPGAMCLAVAPRAVTTVDSEDLRPELQPSPARSNSTASTVQDDFAALDLSTRAIDDITPSGQVETTSSQVDGEQAAVALSPPSSTSGESFVVVAETPTPPVSVPFPEPPVDTSDETTTAGGESAVVDTTTTQRAGLVHGRCIQPPNLRIADVMEVCTRIGPADIDDAVQHLSECRHIPFTPEVLRRIFHAVVATRGHTASRLLEHLTFLGSTTATDAEIVTAMCFHLQGIVDRATRL